MKTKYKDQISYNEVDAGISDGLREYALTDFPAIDPDDAFLLSKVLINLRTGLLIGTPACESTPANHETAFNWGLNGRPIVIGTELINQVGLLSYSGRAGGLTMPSTAGLRATFRIGGEKDQVNFEDPNDLNVVDTFPIRKLYFNTELYDCIPPAGTYVFEVRVRYNVVTLTTAEQSDLYQRLGY